MSKRRDNTFYYIASSCYTEVCAYVANGLLQGHWLYDTLEIEEVEEEIVEEEVKETKGKTKAKGKAKEKKKEIDKRIWFDSNAI